MWVGMARRESESSGKRSKWLSTSQNQSNGGSSRGRKIHRESQSMRKGIRKDKALLRVVHTWRTAGVMGFKRNTVGALLRLRDRRFKRDNRWYPLRFAGSSTPVSNGFKIWLCGGACQLPIRVRSSVKWMVSRLQEVNRSYAICSVGSVPVGRVRGITFHV